MLAKLVFIVYIKYIECANILAVFPFPSYSHQILYQPIWEELSLRRHNVTVVTPNPSNNPSLTNLIEINAKDVYKLWKQKSIEDILSKDTNAFLNLHFSYSFTEVVVAAIFSGEDFQKLNNDKTKTFDLILLESFPPLINAVGGRFQAPIISVCPVGGITSTNDIFGNINHPVLYPDSFLSFHNQQLSLWDRTVSFLFSIWSLYYHYYSATPRSYKLAKTFFGENIPYIQKIEKNASMVFFNVNPTIYPRRPNSPAVVEIYQVHIKPTKPLPQDLQDFLDEAKEGVIYFSLGSIIKSVQLENDLKSIIMEAFSELPYKVIWKYESDHLPNRPSNVIIRKWLPQQDILAHKNIRAFVTQGGLLSTSESIFHAVPIVGLPFVGDQPMNIQKIVGLGIGIGLDPATVTKDKLKRSIIEVCENKIYKEQIKNVRKYTYDKPLKGVEEAVWWSEYVIRHKGATHLKSPNANMSLFHYLLLDVFILFLILLTVIFFMINILYKLVQFGVTQFRGYEFGL